jgi:hypothetical protein
MLAVAPPASAGPILAVDFGVSDAGAAPGSPNEVQAGFSDFSVDPMRDADLQLVSGSVSRTFSGITVSVSGTGLLAFYDRVPDVNHTLGNLLEDLAVVFEGDLILTLSGLSAGTYSMTTYHHVPEEEDAGDPFDMSLDTGSGALPIFTDVATSFGTSNPDPITTRTFQFTASGVDPVQLTLLGGELLNPLLNGFELTRLDAVPEPGSLMLLGVGIAAALTGGRHRSWRRARGTRAAAGASESRPRAA